MCHKEQREKRREEPLRAVKVPQEDRRTGASASAAPRRAAPQLLVLGLTLLVAPLLSAAAAGLRCVVTGQEPL